MAYFDDTQTAFKLKSNKDLKKAKLLFKLMGNPFLTKLGTYFFKIPFVTDIPFIKPIVRNTIYNQFVGGVTTDECLIVAKNLYRSGVRSIMDYSVEGQSTDEEFNHVKEEILKLIQIAKENPAEIPCVVFKPTGFGRIDIYEKAGNNLPMADHEMKSWENIRKRYQEVCQSAYDNGVPIMADAEDSWMQDAADQLMDEMMQKFNKERCIVWSTLQLYRHDRLSYLQEIYEKAKNENYLIGFKIVRGAYMEKEWDRAKEMGYRNPIQPNKEATDRDFNQAMEFMVEHIDRISLFAGTHNEYSSELLTRLMEEHNIQKDDHRIWFGQLYGMSDNISFILGEKGYNVAKYLPYGPIKKVMPYLVRRAQENTSVAGQTGRELSLIQKEINRRKSK
ncbi:MAG: proline dehydrogenase family protein [Weeksellaceae bacterium]|nr:proline dehydrogenase family protein [Weeksellaceae bacterium]